MKSMLFLILTLLITTSTYAQINLVPNPSFEDTVYCPFGDNQMDACSNWMNYGNSPEYFNICTGFGGPPLNYNLGYQFPNTGNAMAGIVSYARPNLPSGPNYREVIGTKLIDSLIIGQRYYFSFYVNSSNMRYTTIAANKIGLRFSTVPFDSCCPPPINNFAHLYSDSIVIDSIGWTFLNGSFMADSSYSYVSIGNFFDDQDTDTLNIGQFPGVAYYYVDDVCVSTDSIYNSTWTGIKDVINLHSFKLNVYPNPALNEFIINKNCSKKDVLISNLFGQIIDFDIFSIENNSTKIRLKQLLYNEFIYLNIQDKNIKYHTKVLINP